MMTVSMMSDDDDDDNDYDDDVNIHCGGKQLKQLGDPSCWHNVQIYQIQSFCRI